MTDTVVGKGTVAAININFEFYNGMETMKVRGDLESFQEQANFPGICASNDYLLVTEVNENSKYACLLCLQATDDQLECVGIKNKFQFTTLTPIRKGLQLYIYPAIVLRLKRRRLLVGLTTIHSLK